MKTTQLHKISAAVFMMAVLAVVSVNPAFAQRRTRKYQPEKREHSKGNYKKRDHQSKKERANQNQRNDDRFRRNNHDQDRVLDRDYSYRSPSYARHDNDRNWNKNRHWNNNQNRHREHPVYINHRHYRIPRYNGRVRVYARAPWGQRHPVVIRHRYGDIYCFGGNFYTYYPRYGYVQIELPRDMVFTALPRDAVRVRADGHLMFRLGDVYFEFGSGGYHISNYRAYPKMYGYIDRY